MYIYLLETRTSIELNYKTHTCCITVLHSKKPENMSIMVIVTSLVSVSFNLIFVISIHIHIPINAITVAVTTTTLGI